MKWIVVAALVSAACGTKSGSGGGSGGGGSAGSGSAGSGSAQLGEGRASATPPTDDPTPAIIAQAFGGKVPAFPLLAANGIAAVAVATPLRQTEASIYSVMFLPVGAGGPWDSVETIPLVDAMLAKLLAEGSPDGTAQPIFDRDRLTTQAQTIVTRLGADKFSAFEGSVPALAMGTTTVGPARLEQQRTESGLLLQLSDPSGIVQGTDNLPNQPTAMMAGEECIAKPMATRAWFDTPRKRVLVELSWSVVEPCVAPEVQYRLFALR